MSTRSSSQEAPSFLHAPMIDLNTPSSESLLSLLSKILHTMNTEGSSAVYIHCWGGRGRAGLVGACLVSLIFPELDGKKCLDWVQKGYDTRDGAKLMPLPLRKSPQTASQRNFVFDFIKDTQDNHL